MFNFKRVLLNGLLFAAFAIVPLTAGHLSAGNQQLPESTKVEKSEVSWWGGGWGGGWGYRPYWRNYYRPYYYPYYYYPYRPYNYYYW